MRAVPSSPAAMHRDSPPVKPAAVLALLLLLAVACGGGAAGGDVVTPRPPDPHATALPAPAPSTPAATPPGPTGEAPTGQTPTGQATAGTTGPPDETGTVVTGTFPVEVADEVSGIAASAVDPDRLWLLDDGPGTSAVVAVRLDGTVEGSITMVGADGQPLDGRDTEALAIAPCAVDDPTPCLYVGDVGDNLAQHDAVRVHRFPEPTAPADGTTAEVATATFTLATGPADVEAMVVDDAGVPWLLTKEEDQTTVLRAAAFADGEMAVVGRLPLPRPRTALQSLFTGVVVTDAALHPDGTTLLLRTYDSVLRLDAADGQGLADLPRWAVAEVLAPDESQGEAITIHPRPTTQAAPADGLAWVTVGEGSGAISRTSGAR